MRADRIRRKHGKSVEEYEDEKAAKAAANAIPPGMKRCTYEACSDPIKPVSEFSKNKRNKKDGLASWCKVCVKAHYKTNKKAISARTKAYREANKEAIAAQGKRYREANKEACASRAKKYYAADKETCLARAKKWKFLNEYGITLEQYNAEVVACNGKCPNCRQAFEDRGGPVADHCHVTGMYRGVICNNCNTAEGYLKAGGPQAVLNLYHRILSNELLSYTKAA
jgi:hypothetical protein